MQWQAAERDDVQRLPDSFTVPLEGGEVAWVNKRPGLDAFLQRLSRDCNVVVFTAAAADYAGAVLDRLDPSGSLIQRRFYRDSCRRLGLSLVKDLRAVVPADELCRTVLVDNSLFNFLPQPANGIPVPAFYDQRDDRHLEGVLELVQRLQGEKDVRPVLRKAFGLEQRLGVGVAGERAAEDRMGVMDWALVLAVAGAYAFVCVGIIHYVFLPLGGFAVRIIGLPSLELMAKMSGGDGSASVRLGAEAVTCVADALAAQGRCTAALCVSGQLIGN